VVKVIAVAKYSQSVDQVTASQDAVIDHVGDVVNLVWKGQVIGSWDGTNGSGQAVGNGEYYIKIDNVDSFGAETSVTTNVSVDRSLSNLTVKVYNQSGEIVRTLYSTTGADIGSVTGATLSAETIEPGYVGADPNAVSSTSVVISNGVAATWDGRNDAGVVVSNGMYYVEITADDGKGNQTVVTKSVNVLGVNGPGPGLVIAPNVLTAAGPIASISVGVPGMTLRATLYTVAGEKVGTITGQAGTSSVKWDSSGKSSGLYIALVEVYDGSNTFQGRYQAKLIIQK